MASNLQTYNSNRRLSYWAEQIRQCKESGLSVAKWCEVHHISQSSYYRWQKAIFRAASDQQKNKLVFAELPSVESTTPYQPPAENVLAVRVTGSRMCMEIYSNASPEIVSALCRVLE